MLDGAMAEQHVLWLLLRRGGDAVEPWVVWGSIFLATWVGVGAARLGLNFARAIRLSHALPPEEVELRMDMPRLIPSWTIALAINIALYLWLA
jgi:hypothetical protein